MKSRFQMLSEELDLDWNVSKCNMTQHDGQVWFVSNSGSSSFGTLCWSLLLWQLCVPSRYSRTCSFSFGLETAKQLPRAEYKSPTPLVVIRLVGI